MPRMRKITDPNLDASTMRTNYVSAIQIRMVRERAIADVPMIRSSHDAVMLLRDEIGACDQENLVVLALDNKNRVIAMHRVYTGTVNSSAVRISEVFRTAIIVNAVSIIIAHNHPSGDPTPSPEDVLVTRQIRDAGKLFDIELLDHLVIGCGTNAEVSMRERGLGFSS